MLYKIWTRLLAHTVLTHPVTNAAFCGEIHKQQLRSNGILSANMFFFNQVMILFFRSDSFLGPMMFHTHLLITVYWWPLTLSGPHYLQYLKDQGGGRWVGATVTML